MSSDGALFVLRLEDHGALEQALARLREEGERILDMEVHPPDLEDVFLRLTGK